MTSSRETKVVSTGLSFSSVASLASVSKMKASLEEGDDDLRYEMMKDMREHILHRPSMYIGDMEHVTLDEYIVRDGKVKREKITYVPGFVRCFIEILSNAQDNVWRTRERGGKCSKIELILNIETGETTVFNDGMTIPIKVHDEHKIYIPEMVFGKFMSSSNYNDVEDRKTSGTHGIGAKATNAMSTYFKVETVDETRGLKYVQEWKDNMGSVTSPKITKSTEKGYTRVTWIPDFDRFKFDGYLPVYVHLFTRYMYECAMMFKVPTYVNGVKVPVTSLKDYALLLSDTNVGKEVLDITTSDSEVVVYPSTRPVICAYTNGVYNSQGGVHVDAWSKAIFTQLAEMWSPKPKKDSEVKPVKLTARDIKPLFSMFIVCTLTNPKFPSQSKERLTSPKPKAEVEESLLKKILKWSVADKVKSLIDSKRMKLLKDISKKNRGKPVKNLEDANFAGTSKSKDCSFIICEGKSARTFVVAGINKGVDEKTGRDYFGIFPSRGKILNVRNASDEDIAEDEEIQGIINALGLEFGLDYTQPHNFSKLRYGRVIVLADGDNDGIHIEGLVHNFFHYLFPTLLKRETSFIYSMRTPIVRVYLKGGGMLPFYRMDNFKMFMTGNEASVKEVKYFKGLGTTKISDVMESFGEKMVVYSVDETTDLEMDKAFNGKKSNLRKKWLTEYDPNNLLVIDSNVRLTRSTFTQFIENDLILFSAENCQRSLPNFVDGLKESQRKVLYAVLELKLKYKGKSRKVGRLASTVSEMTEYHHGEQCLAETIIGMAANYVGSNNVPLLYRDGGFGSRLSNGADAAAPRYIYTRMDMLTSLVFRAEDLPLLKKQVGEEGEIEPPYYVPVVPLVLINGVRAGIGTGWSCNVPAYNPLEVVGYLREWIKGGRHNLDGNILFTDLPELSPWYLGTKSPIVKIDDRKYASYGIIEDLGYSKFRITECPVGYSTDKLKEKLDTLLEAKEISKYENRSTIVDVDFTVWGKIDIDSLKLRKFLSTSNMVFNTPSGKIQKFRCIEEVLEEFSKIRLDLYSKRRQYILADLKREHTTVSYKRKFVEQVMNDELKINRRARRDVEIDLKTMGYPLVKNKYDYLMKISVSSFTKEKLEELDKEIKKLEAEIEKMRGKKPSDIWLEELDEFEEGYKQYVKEWWKEQDLLRQEWMKNKNKNKK